MNDPRTYENGVRDSDIQWIKDMLKQIKATMDRRDERCARHTRQIWINTGGIATLTLFIGGLFWLLIRVL